MNIDQRKNKILELLTKNGIVKVSALSETMGISEVTIRSDLADMESKGLLTRVHGGAISSYKPYCSMNFNQRLETNQEEKNKIAKRIASFIEPNDTVMFNSGTTTLLAFRHLPQEYHLNIITNSMSIALEASNNPNFQVALVGGSVNGMYQFTYGSDAAQQLKNYHADKLILSVDGIDFSGGFSTYYTEEAFIDRIMLEQSEMTIVAADRSKFRRNAFVKISDLETADYIVTTCSLDKAEKEKLTAAEIQVVSVD